MTTLDIEKFDPTVAELQSMVQITMAVDTSNLKEVKEKRIGLKNVRVTITRKGKELREDALAFQKAVIAKEKELIAIIEPEENRLAGIEEEAQKAKEREERIALMPERKKRLDDIGSEYSDELIIGMDASEFQSFLNTRVAEKNEKERLENERKGRELKEAEDKLQRETDTREREEKARVEEREKIEREKKEEEERLEKQLADERKQLEIDTKYQEFLKEHGVIVGSDEWKIDRLVHSSKERIVRIYKFVAEFKIE